MTLLNCHSKYILYILVINHNNKSLYHDLHSHDTIMVSINKSL